MFNCHSLTRVGLLAVVMALPGLSFAAGDAAKDLNDLSCKDVMRFSGEHRTIAIAFMHGYFLGKKGATAFDTDKLSAATDKFTDHCLDNPKMKAIDVMAKFVGK